MKSRDSRDVLSVYRLRKRCNKQAKISLNNNTTLPWKRNIKICFKKRVTTEERIFYKLLHRGCSDKVDLIFTNSKRVIPYSS